MKRHDATQVLITRFNVQTSPGDARGVEPTWLRQRLELFAEVCVPSVAAQTGPTRPWFVFMNAASPPWASEAVAKHESDVDLRLVSVDGVLDDARLRRHIVQDVQSSPPHLITSRLDNDDALAPQYLDVVLDEAPTGTRVLLVATRGLQLTSHALYRVRDPHSPFMSMVESNDSAAHTVHCVPHHYAHRAYSTRALTVPDLWLQSIHGSNVANSVTGVRVPMFELGESFSHLSRSEATRDLAYHRDRVVSGVRATGRLGYTALRDALPARAPHDWRPVE